MLKIKDKGLLEKVKRTILQVEDSRDLQQIQNIKKIEGFKNYYRIRIGDYRIGLELKKDTIGFITIATRKDIYKKFP